MALLTSMALLTNYDYTHHGPTYHSMAPLLTQAMALLLNYLLPQVRELLSSHPEWPLTFDEQVGMQPATIRDPACNHT